MATIIIKDLTESIDLDRRAMTAIVGGARTRGHPMILGRTVFRGARIVDYPGGILRNPNPPQGTPLKQKG